MLSKFSVKKPLTVFVAVIIVLVLGVVSYTSMTPDLLPNMDFPYVIIMTTYPGASPEKVEEKVTKPIEQAVSTVENFSQVTSSSNDNYSMVMLELEDDANMDSAMLDIREKLDIASADWDDAVGEPSLLKINPNVLPVMVAAVDIKNMELEELSAFLEDDIIPKLEGVEGVAGVNASGLLESKINVFLKSEKIDKVNENLKNAVAENFDSGMKQISDGKAKINSTKSELTAQLAELNAQLPTLKQTKEQLTTLQTTVTGLETTEAQLESTISQLTELNGTVTELETAMSLLPPGTPQYEQAAAALAQIDSQLSSMGLSRGEIGSALSEAQSGYEQTSAGLAQIDTQLSAMGIARGDISSKLAEIDSGIAQMESGIPTIESTLTQLDTSLAELEEKEKELIKTKTETVDGTDVSKQLTMDSVSKILTAQNFSMPAGYVAEDGVNYLVRVGDKLSGEEELEGLVLFDMGLDGIDPIKLTDVADVVVTDNSAEIYAKINGNDGVVLSFTKQSNAATADVSVNLAERFEKLSEDYEGLQFTPLMDQGDYIELIVDSVVNNLLWGAVLAVVILLIFLKDIRPTLLVALSIPVSLIFAIVLMYFSGVTLNMISLSGLAVGVGMLVDNSVVVIENIYRLRNKGVPAVKAAVAGARQVAGAVTASTLTTVCVFLPIVFVQGITRQLFTDMALTIGYSLLASLIVALTLVPAVSSGLLKNIKPKNHRLFDKALKLYEKGIRWSLGHRAAVIILVIVLLVGSIAAALSRGFIFMPEMESAQITATLQMPEDTKLEDTVAASDAVIEEIQQIDGVETVGAMLSSGSLMSGGSSDSTNVSMYILLSENAKISGAEVADRINAIGEGKDYTLTASGASDMSSGMSMMGGSGVGVNLYSDNLDDLTETAKAVAEKLSAVEGIGEVDNGIGDVSPELSITVNKDKAAEKGLTVAQVYMSVSQAVSTETTSTSLAGENGEYSVVVVDPKADDLELDTVKNLKLTVTGFDGSESEVALSDVADISMGETMSSISRVGQRRYLTVTGELEDGYNVSLVTNAAKSALADYTPPTGTTLEFSGENENIMESMTELVKMLLLGVLLVYLIMVAQFQSLLSPFIVMFTIPLAFTGGFLALLIAGMEVSVISMIGFVMLVGIIVNNGIVLVDYINQLRRDGMEKREAIVKAGMTRMRPILMTALTTIIALIGTAFGVGMGSDMMQPVAVVCVGGLIYATFMTLFFVPVMYDLFNRKKELRVVRDKDMEYNEEDEEIKVI